jgi:integrase
MNGSLRQRGASSWELRVYQGMDADTGRRRYATRTVQGSRAEAQAELALLVGQVEYPRRRALDTTLRELFERWYARASPGWAPNTRRQTRSVIRVHLVPRFGDLPVGELVTVEIDEFYADLRAYGGRNGRSLTDGTVRRVHGVLHRALAQAVRWEWVWTNPAEHASPPVVEHREMFSPPPEAVARMLAATYETAGLHAYFRLSVSSGARRGQMCGLRWHDVDLVCGAVSFRRSIAEGIEGLVVVPTKNRRRNRVEIDDDTVAGLRRHRDVAERRATAAGTRLVPRGYVFARDPEGTSPWRPNWVTKTFIRLRDEVGLTGHRLHDLRHFMATEMLMAGEPLPIVSARLAHARGSTTLNYYAHAVPAATVARPIAWPNYSGALLGDSRPVCVVSYEQQRHEASTLVTPAARPT